jgi:hypothetical protein
MCPQFIDEMEHLEKNSHSFINITPDRLDYIRDISTMIAVGISFIVISFYRYDYVQQPDMTYNYQPLIDDGPQAAMDYLGYF